MAEQSRESWGLPAAKPDLSPDSEPAAVRQTAGGLENFATGYQLRPIRAGGNTTGLWSLHDDSAYQNLLLRKIPATAGRLAEHLAPDSDRFQAQVGDTIPAAPIGA